MGKMPHHSMVLKDALKRIAVVYVQVLCCGIYVFNPLSGNAPYFVSLLCLTPDNFTRQVDSACMPPLNGLT